MIYTAFIGKKLFLALEFAEYFGFVRAINLKGKQTFKKGTIKKIKSQFFLPFSGEEKHLPMTQFSKSAILQLELKVPLHVGLSSSSHSHAV